MIKKNTILFFTLTSNIFLNFTKEFPCLSLRDSENGALEVAKSFALLWVLAFKAIIDYWRGGRGKCQSIAKTTRLGIPSFLANYLGVAGHDKTTLSAARLIIACCAERESAEKMMKSPAMGPHLSEGPAPEQITASAPDHLERNSRASVNLFATRQTNYTSQKLFTNLFFIGGPEHSMVFP